MDTVKYAVVGCGSAGVAGYLRRLDEVPPYGGQLVAVCDRVEERAAPWAERFGVPYYLDLDEMLDKVDFDLLVNVTNVQAHYTINLKGLQAGRHVYSQKPMTVTVEEATHLIEEAATRDLKLVAEKAAGLMPDIRMMRKLLDEGVIGKVMWVRSNSTHKGSALQDRWPTDPSWFHKKGAGPLRDVGIERLHMLTTLLGPAKRVSAMSGINTPELVVRGGTFKGKRIEVDEDDVSLLTLDFGDSIFAMLDAAWVNTRDPYTPGMVIYGQMGVIIQPRARGRSLELYRDEPELGIRGWTEVNLIPPARPRPFGFVGTLVHAIECIREDTTPLATGEHARHCIEIIEKAFLAARTGITQTVETAF